MASEGFHENEAHLSAQTKDLHRALVSLQEELEAIDWYQQRMDATEDAELREVLQHNRNEEMEHAALVLEWIRRRSPDFDTRLRPRLFTEGALLALEDTIERAEGDGGEQRPNPDKDGSAAGNGAGTTPTVGSPRKGSSWTT